MDHAWSYEMIEGRGEDSIVIQQGKALALNVSSDGILLLMDQVPQVQQLLRVHTPRSNSSHTSMLFEVCWTSQVQTGLHDCKGLVGCRLISGPSPYLLLQ